MTNTVLRGRDIAARMLEHIAADVKQLKQSGWSPKLVSLKIGASPEVDLYIRNQHRNAAKAGIAFEEREYAADISEQELDAAIQTLNADPRVTGIIVQRPIPDTLNIKHLQSVIHPLKDVEGMNPASIGNIVYNELELGPCTAVAAVEMLKSTGVVLQGLEATVIGHSEIVGKPIAFLLMSEGATVTVCHHMTREVTIHSRRADAVFVAVGKPGLLRGDMIKPGAVVIDIGINQVETEDGKTKVVGDCDFDSCVDVAGWITPVPGGVGPVTVAILMRNTTLAAKRQAAQYDKYFRHSAVSITNPQKPG